MKYIVFVNNFDLQSIYLGITLICVNIIAEIDPKDKNLEQCIVRG